MGTARRCAVGCCWTLDVARRLDSHGSNGSAGRPHTRATAHEGDQTRVPRLRRSLAQRPSCTGQLPPPPPSHSTHTARPQTTLQASLSDLTLCSSLINHLGILSPNETLDDINTRDLRCLLVEGLRGEMEVLVKTTGGKERMQWLSKAKVRPSPYEMEGGANVE